MPGRVVVLDSGVVSRLVHPTSNSTNWRCLSWARALQRDGVPIVLPEIIDYELRRELPRLKHTQSVEHLDRMRSLLTCEALSTETMRLAAQIWAEARRRGRPTAGERSLDIDVILAAQARVIESRGQPVIVATTNVKHLSRYVAAEHWETIAPD